MVCQSACSYYILASYLINLLFLQLVTDLCCCGLFASFQFIDDYLTSSRFVFHSTCYWLCSNGWPGNEGRRIKLTVKGPIFFTWMYAVESRYFQLKTFHCYLSVLCHYILLEVDTVYISCRYSSKPYWRMGDSARFLVHLHALWAKQKILKNRFSERSSSAKTMVRCVGM